ncbi:LOW QUALITY PROTEIN: DUF659 domain-containing protein/Dimer_Tnp_hAT domain-containing protein, partial [Cephalotus follicularis]
SAIEKAFNKSEREHLDYEIVKTFYLAGLPFNLARNPYFQSTFPYAANHNIARYLPPGYNLLRTTLFQKEKANIDRLCASIRNSWNEKGVSIVNDGWSDSQRRPLINFMAVSDGDAMFLKSVDCSGQTKDMHFIYNLLKEVINEVEYTKVVQVITDNASNYKGAGLIEKEFPSIVWTPCAVHTLNLVVKSYKQLVAIFSLYFLICYFFLFSICPAMFSEFVSLKLLSVAETRFASMVIMLKRFKLIKSGIQNMVISDKWILYRDNQQRRARTVKEKLLDDLWWDSIYYILSFTAPIYDMIRFCDTNKPSLYLVYDMWDMMIEQVKKAIYYHEVKMVHEESHFFQVVHEILIDRWDKNNTPLHYLAHALNPKVPPHKDMEINQERTKCIRKYFPNLEERNKVNMEYVKFVGKNGDFRDFDSIENRYAMDPKALWVLHGACVPMLQTIALRLLAQLSSSSCAERNWSTYSFVHSMKRNKMTPKRAKDLVYIHSNLRL